MGAIVLQAKVFSEIVKKLPTDAVEIEVLGSLQTVIRSGKSEFNLIGLDAEEYPHLPQIEENSKFQIATDLLKASNVFQYQGHRNTTKHYLK